LFILFMFFIFGGYHQNKFEQREEEVKKREEKDTLVEDETKEG